MSLRLQQLAVIVWSAVAAIAVFPASAQDSDGIGIDEIVVTARKCRASRQPGQFVLASKGDFHCSGRLL
jgi:hypothetical protein